MSVSLPPCPGSPVAFPDCVDAGWRCAESSRSSISSSSRYSMPSPTPMEPLPAAPRSTAPVFCARGRSENGTSCAPTPTAMNIDAKTATRKRMAATSTSSVSVIGNGLVMECGFPRLANDRWFCRNRLRRPGSHHQGRLFRLQRRKPCHDTCTDTRDDGPGLDIRGARHALGHAAYRAPSSSASPSRATSHAPPCARR